MNWVLELLLELTQLLKLHTAQIIPPVPLEAQLQIQGFGFDPSQVFVHLVLEFIQ